MICSAFAQQAGGGEARPRATMPPLAFKVEWVRPANQVDTKIRYTPVQENVADPNVEIKYYGSGAKQILTTGAPGSDITPYGVWTGTAQGPFAITFKLKNNNYVDLTGLAHIKWSTKTFWIPCGSSGGEAGERHAPGGRSRLPIGDPAYGQ